MRVKGAKRNPKLTETTEPSNGGTIHHRIHNVFIIDASGSMSGAKYQSAIYGVNELLKSIAIDTDTENTATIVEFEERNITRRLDLATRIPETYKGMGCGGSTPLNEAVGETLEYVVSERQKKYSADDKILVNIFTDGQENYSRGKYSDPEVLAKLIKDLESQGVTVTFVGTKNEVQYAIKNLHVDQTNTLVHDNTGDGVKKSFLRTVSSRMAYSKSVSRGEDVTMDFYSKSVDE